MIYPKVNLTIPREFIMLDLFRSLNRVVKEHIDSKMDVIEVWP